MSPRGVKELEAFLEERQSRARIVRLDRDTTTVASAAEALGVSPERIIKSLVFIAGDDPVLVIAGGPNRVDRRRLADILGLAPGKVRLATPDEVLAATGYAVGGVPPVGHPRPIKVYIDRRVAEAPTTVFGGGGADRVLLEIEPGELIRLTGAEVIDLT
jgi:prolyl-tRNA editing enzyme YbaK/EbsC (Cys-tRNA(Pro) deacylase)